MISYFGLSRITPTWTSSVVCIGTFDGVHRGHQAVIANAVCAARAMGSPCILVTFDRHPAATLAPDRVPKALSPPTENLALLEQLGVDVLVVLTFDDALSQVTASEFLGSTLKAGLNASKIVVGHDFAFGHVREGTPEWLQQRIDTSIISPFELDGERVSSSRIRAAIAGGDVELAKRMLGRPFELEGIVVAGDKIGRTLGFPTANLALAFDSVVPSDGVYAGEAVTPWGRFDAAISLGTRPTVAGKEWVCEAHLLDYGTESLYGRTVRLRFARLIRKQVRFASVEELKEWIARDVIQVRSTIA
jgi:riboflavin kinase/FMN adenylyltransferase